MERNIKKAVMLFKERIKYSFQSPDCLSDWNVELVNQEENSPCLKNLDVSLPVISIHIFYSLLLHIIEVAGPHFYFSLPRLDHKGSHSFSLSGV